ncbi:MAG: hypothetical protein WBY53_19600 [Acidobacteriaceae bacterium]
MDHLRPKRPPLATLVCIYEVFIVVFAIAAHYWLIYMTNLANQRYPNHPFLHIHSPTLLQSTASWLSYILALAAAIALWRMLRAAFVLLASRFLISLIWFIVGLTRISATPIHLSASAARLMSPTELRLIGFGIGFIALMLSASIAWYAYDVTKTQMEPSQLDV